MKRKLLILSFSLLIIFPIKGFCFLNLKVTKGLCGGYQPTVTFNTIGDKEKAAKEITSILKIFPDLNRQKMLSNELRMFLGQLKKLLLPLVNVKMRDMDYTKNAIALEEYIHLKLRYIKLTEYPSIISAKKAALVMKNFALAPSDNLDEPPIFRPWTLWCWRCLWEFIKSTQA